MAFTGYHAASAGHVSVSLRGLRGSSSFGDRHGEGGLSELGKSFTAGLLAHAAELCVFYAPTANAYRRFGSDILSPSTLTWGVGNRTCAVRADGPETSLRLENRIPGSDANPYLSAAATLAAGLDGVVRQLKAPPETKGNGHDADAPRLPDSLDEALAAWEASTWVRETFGGTVQDHYASLARVEVEAADAGDGLEWERARYFDGT
jgi:glutamine synthetase